MWRQGRNGCSDDNICYKISNDLDHINDVYNLLLKYNGKAEVFTKEELKIMADGDQGICLPEFKCEAKKIGVNEILLAEDTCEEGLVEKKDSDNGIKICVDQKCIHLLMFQTR